MTIFKEVENYYWKQKSISVISSTGMQSAPSCWRLGYLKMFHDLFQYSHT